MEGENSFHEKTKAAKPNQPCKPTTYWAGVLMCDKNPAGPKTEEDYLWVKCHQRVTADLILQQYKIRNLTEDVVLRNNGRIVGNEPMKLLDVYEDHVIAFEAVKKSDIDVSTAASIPRKPLQPSGRQISQSRVSIPEPASLASDVKKEHNSPYPGAKVHGHLRSPSKPKVGFEDGHFYHMGRRDENKPPSTTLSPLSQLANAATETSAPLSVPQAFRQASNEGVSGPFPSKATGWTVNPPFMRYLQQCRVSWESRNVGRTEDEIQDLAWESWMKLSSEERAPYYSIGKVHRRGLPAPLLPDRNTSSSTLHPFPSAHQLSGGVQQSARPSAADKSDSGFMKWLANMRERHVPIDENDKVTQEQSAWDSWMLFTPEQRESYCAEVASRSEQVQDDDVMSEIDFRDQFTTEAEPTSQTEIQQPKTFQLQNLIADASLDVLESSVEGGVKFLDDLKGPLLEKVESSPDAAQWVQQIDKLRNQAVKTRTVIGVVGNTGAGKSSVINAMLDEERLVPTNTMRACTAVVTELSYNYDDDTYRAEIEFITIADWEKELQILFKDLLDDSGNVSRDCANPDTDAGIAYAKIKAVYPKKTKEDISNSNIKKMLQDVSHLLGNTRKITESDSLMFYRGLQHFVDSKEKVTSKKDKDKKNEPKEMEFWPLIKVVRIFVKSPALATGAVIVDLPGVHDANAARAAVAEGYMKQCTGLWIVAPIIRAVDDKAAKNLLGESFKRQLKMDGGFSSVTFICSKTDDISLTEASDSLGLDEENGPAWEEMDRYARKQKELKKKLEALGETKTAYGETVADVDEQLELWEDLEAKIKDGNTVYPPNRDKKRKKTGAEGSRKKARRSSNDDDDDFIDDGEDDAEVNEDVEEDEATSSPNPPLTEEQITSKISELRTTKKEGRRQRTELDQKMKAIRTEIAAAKEAEKKIESQISKVCIEGRNAYSKGAIQQDFAAGMKELDQEIAAEDDEENFNPDADIRDYDEVARSLPVFCVSSRGYQKLQGRLKKDPAVPGFQSLEQTEIPQLQAHCKQLTVAGRTTACKRFMTNLSQLLNSMNLWASNDGTGANLTPEQRAKEAKFLQKSLENLESGLEKIISTVVKDLKNELADNIYDKYETAVANALIKATQTSSDWGRPVNREDRAAGGYFWSSYKAVCRRNGIYSNAQGPHDWNQALSDPMLKVLAGGWERTFTRRSPAVLSGLAKNAGNLFKAFHRDIDARARKTGASVAGLHMLQQQLQVYEDIFKDLSATTKESIDNQQKDINREFVPVIEKAMAEAYEVCTNERGSGSYARMKTAMNAHVERQKHRMFEDSTNEVQQRLKAMIRGVDETMSNKADEVFVAMSRDYRSVLGGGDVPHGEMMPKWQRAMRKEVKGVINKAERIFKRVAGIEVEDDEDESEVTALDHAGTPLPKERVKQEEKHLAATQGIVPKETAVKTEDEATPPSAIIEYGPNVKMEVSDEELRVEDAPRDQVDSLVVGNQPQEHSLFFEEAAPLANLPEASACINHSTRPSFKASDHRSSLQVQGAMDDVSATSDEDIDYEGSSVSSENAADSGSSSDEA
ncbi:hypothetical protein MMC17_007910 [Xylographa soralifera]|nr:hypothetical protein [Xylographa soralifera]